MTPRAARPRPVALSKPARPGLWSPDLSEAPGDGRERGGSPASRPAPARYPPEQTGEGVARGPEAAAATAAAAAAPGGAAAAAAPEA